MINKIAKKSDGFSLVELLVAMSILLLMATVFSVLFSTSISGIIQAGTRSEELFLAQQDLEGGIAERTDGTGQGVLLEFPNTTVTTKGRTLVSDTFKTFAAEPEEFIRYVAVGNGVIIASIDGHDWVKVKDGLVETLYSIDWGGVFPLKEFIAVGNNGLVYRSEKGLTWEEYLTFNIDHLKSISWINSFPLDTTYQDVRFLAVGDNSTLIVLYYEGSELKIEEVYINSLGNDYRFNSIAWGSPGNIDYEGVDAGIYVIVGEENNNGLIVTSNVVEDDEQEVWDKGHKGLEGLGFLEAKPLNGVIWAAGKFVAVGDNGLVITSEDGDVWEKQEVLYSGGSIFGHNLKDVAWGNNRFVTVGDEGSIIWSADGVKWSYLDHGFILTAGISLNAVTWSYNQFIVVGDEGIVMASDTGNASDWSLVLDDKSIGDLFDVCGR